MRCDVAGSIGVHAAPMSCGFVVERTCAMFFLARLQTLPRRWVSGTCTSSRSPTTSRAVTVTGHSTITANKDGIDVIAP